LLAGKAYNEHWYKEKQKRLGMTGIAFGATTEDTVIIIQLLLQLVLSA